MTANFPGPYELRVNYTTNEDPKINTHQLRLSLRMATLGTVGGAFSTWIPYQKDGGSSTHLGTHLTNLVNALKTQYNTLCTLVNAELWSYAPSSFDAVFVAASAIAVAGTTGTTVPDARQTIWTFRTALGGIMKVDLRGTIWGAGVKVATPGTGAQADITNYFLGATCPFWGRDNGYAIAHLWVFPGQNEKAVKEIWR